MQHCVRFVEEKFRPKYKHLLSVKNENKNSKTSFTSKNICISSNLFCYFFEGTPFFRRGAKLSIFHQNQDALRLPQVKLAKVSGKKICKRAEVPPKSLPKQNSKKKKTTKMKNFDDFFSMLLKNFAQTKKFKSTPLTVESTKHFISNNTCLGEPLIKSPFSIGPKNEFSQLPHHYLDAFNCDRIWISKSMGTF